MRITKEFDERKQEIIEKSSILFNRKGYMKTSVADIVREVAVAKGTFYYYFKSKEDVLDAIIDQEINQICEMAIIIANSDALNVHQKLLSIILGSDVSQAKVEKADNDESMDVEDIRETLHLKDNEKFHLKSIKEINIKLAPILAQVVEQGNKEGVFNTPYPLETIEHLLVSSSFLFDEGIFDWEPEELKKKKTAFVYLMEVSLGVQRGSLHYLLEVL